MMKFFLLQIMLLLFWKMNQKSIDPGQKAGSRADLLIFQITKKTSNLPRTKRLRFLFGSGTIIDHILDPVAAPTDSDILSVLEQTTTEH